MAVRAKEPSSSALPQTVHAGRLRCLAVPSQCAPTGTSVVSVRAEAATRWPASLAHALWMARAASWVMSGNHASYSVIFDTSKPRNKGDESTHHRPNWARASDALIRGCAHALRW